MRADFGRTGMRPAEHASVVGPREAEHSYRPFKRLPRRSRQLTTMLCMLVELRKDAGLNQTALADRLGITQSEVSKYERGERVLDLPRLRDWLLALEIEFTPFFAALERELQRQDAGIA
jgi:ribosome-binding protein aMBF1 (putative translation factor)